MLVFTHVVFHIKIRELTRQPIYIIAARATTGCQGAPKCHPFHFLQDTPRRFKMDVTVAKLRFFHSRTFCSEKDAVAGNAEPVINGREIEKHLQVIEPCCHPETISLQNTRLINRGRINSLVGGFTYAAANPTIFTYHDWAQFMPTIFGDLGDIKLGKHHMSV